LEINILHNEREILARVSDGDERAFLLLHKHYYAALRPIIEKYFDAGNQVEEILQQTFLKVWLNRDKLPAIENLRAWIYKIAYREYLMALRTRLNYEERLNRYANTLNINDSRVSPQDTAHLQDIRKCIGEVIAKLSPQRRQIYELSRNEGLKISEIAEKLAIAPQTVKNVLFLVLKLIREHLINSGYGPFFLLIFFKII
jgi:RNA polymerase sigma-70 factor (ECF subfamily)